MNTIRSRMSPGLLGGGLTLLLALIFLAAANASAAGIEPEDVTLPAPTPALALGRTNYEAHCAGCHGVNGVGTDKGPPFLHRVYHPDHHADFAFVRAVRYGTRAHHWRFGDMPPVEGITDAQIESIIGYVRALQKANGIF